MKSSELLELKGCGICYGLCRKQKSTSVPHQILWDSHKFSNSIFHPLIQINRRKMRKYFFKNVSITQLRQMNFFQAKNVEHPNSTTSFFNTLPQASGLWIYWKKSSFCPGPLDSEISWSSEKKSISWVMDNRRGKPFPDTLQPLNKNKITAIINCYIRNCC